MAADRLARAGALASLCCNFVLLFLLLSRSQPAAVGSEALHESPHGDAASNRKLLEADALGQQADAASARRKLLWTLSDCLTLDANTAYLSIRCPLVVAPSQRADTGAPWNPATGNSVIVSTAGAPVATISGAGGVSLAAGIQTGGGAVFQGLVNAASLRVPGSSQLNDVSAAAGVYVSKGLTVLGNTVLGTAGATPTPLVVKGGLIAQLATLDNAAVKGQVQTASVLASGNIAAKGTLSAPSGVFDGAVVNVELQTRTLQVLGNAAVKGDLFASKTVQAQGALSGASLAVAGGVQAQGKVSAGAGFSGSAVTVTGGVSAKTLTATTCTCQQRSNLTDFGGRQ